MSAAMQRAIVAGHEDGVGLQALDAAAVRSDELSGAYVIALRFTAEQARKPLVGVWSSGSLDPDGGRILAVDGIARRFTVWPDAYKPEAQITVTDDGLEEAAACVAE